MPKYLIEGKTIVSETPLSDDEIDEIASSVKPSVPVAKTSAEPTQEELLAASKPSFRTATSGIGRSYSEPSPELNRQLGLFGRAAISGLSAPANAVTDFLSGAYNVGANLLGSPNRMPYLSQEQQKGMTQIGIPEPQTAVERAVQSGAEAMAGTGGLAKLAPKVPALVENLARQIPASGAAGLVAQPTAEVTKELTSGVLGEQGSNIAATIAAIGVGAKVGQKVGAIGAEKTPQLFTMDEIKQRATRSYNSLDDAGVYIKPKSVLGMVDDIETNLNKNQFIPQNEPKIANTLDKMREIVGDRFVTFPKLEELRKMANNLRMDTDPNTRRLGNVMVDSVDGYISKINGNDIFAGAGKLDDAVKSVMSARKDWRNASRASVLEDALSVAEAKALDPKASESELIRRGFINIAANKKKMDLFSEPEQNVIKSVANGGAQDKLLTVIGAFSPLRAKFVTGGIMGAVGTQSLPLALSMGGLGLGADLTQSALRRQAAKLAVKQIASGASPTAQPNYGYSGLLGTALSNPNQ